MDGNRRWAAQRALPRAVGHATGAKRVKQIVTTCIDAGVQCLTLFAFSTENWRRPQDEVSGLMKLLMRYLSKEVSELHAEGVQLRIIGDTTQLDAPLRKMIDDVHALTAGNTRFTLCIAVNYGGRWDILQAMRRWQAANPNSPVTELDEATLSRHLSTGDLPEPDLLIRTGGEIRISNFLLWQMAYTEMYFSDVLFPTFGTAELHAAFEWFGHRERRFGAAAGQSGAIDTATAQAGFAAGAHILQKDTQRSA